MCSLWFKKKKQNAFTFGCWCYYAFTVIIFYIITWERWFCVYFLYAENSSHSTKSNLMHIAQRSEDDLRQLSNCCQRFLFLKEMKWLSVLENHYIYIYIYKGKESQPSLHHGIVTIEMGAFGSPSHLYLLIHIYIYSVSKNVCTLWFIIKTMFKIYPSFIILVKEDMYRIFWGIASV